MPGPLRQVPQRSWLTTVVVSCVFLLYGLNVFHWICGFLHAYNQSNGLIGNQRYLAMMSAKNLYMPKSVSPEDTQQYKSSPRSSEGAGTSTLRSGWSLHPVNTDAAFTTPLVQRFVTIAQHQSFRPVFHLQGNRCSSVPAMTGAVSVAASIRKDASAVSAM